MPAIFVHVSDIHFGQEKDERVHIHNDVKSGLVRDAAEQVKALPGSVAHGILVTGDIAHSGVKDQYDAAAAWLDRLALAIGCDTFRIQMVPGNHDLDRSKLSKSAKYLLEEIRNGGASEYEAILVNDMDRFSLFQRFDKYARFCEGYDCPLDTEGRYATNLRVELAPGRAIRFVRLNSSLLCTGDETEEKPELMVGARQFTVDGADGEELVVLIHHPLNWFKDSDDAARYLRNRARVLISGHEHNPRVKVAEVEEGTDFMMLAAGATVPFKSNVDYTFTYNILEFDWDEKQDALAVTIHPRAWNHGRTRFEADTSRLGGAKPKFVLGSPNFRKYLRPAVRAAEAASTDAVPDRVEPILDIVAAVDSKGEPPVPAEPEGYRLALLQFFRDLTEGERLRILVELKAIETGSNERMTQSIERQLFDWLIRQGNIAEVQRMIKDLVSNRKEGEA